MIMALLTRYFLHRAKRSGMVVGGNLQGSTVLSTSELNRS